MKKLFKFLCVTVFTAFTLSAVAQVNMDNKIVLYQHSYAAADGKTYASFSLAPYNDATPIMIKRGTEEKTFILQTEGYPEDFDDYNFLDDCDSIVIYGDVESIEIYPNNSASYRQEEIEKIKIDASTLMSVSIENMASMTFEFVNCPQLEGVYIYNTYVNRKSLDLSAFPLRYLTFDQTNITASDVINLMKDKDLQTLGYSRNSKATTEGYDSIMCALNDGSSASQHGIFYPLYNGSDTNSMKFTKTNTMNALDKNWQIKYKNVNAGVPNGVGTYSCNVSLEEIANENTISIYPNPAKDKITIEGKGAVVITNSLGQVVKEIKDNNDVRTLNIENLPNGVYYIKVGEKIQKLVVE